MRIITGIFLLLFISSCSDFNKNDRLERIEGLNDRLDSIEITIQDGETLDMEELNSKLSEMSAVISSGSDTITLEQAKLIDHYKLVRFNIEPYQKLIQHLDTNITIARINLDNLKSDIEQAQGKRQNYDSYIAHEQSKLDSLQIRKDELIKIKSAILESMDVCYPAIIDELEPNNDSGITIDE